MPRSTPINDPKDFPRFVKWTQYIGAAFIVYGFCWFLFGGHHYAFIGGKDFAEVGLMSLGIAYILGGALLVGIYGRWLYVENDNDKERAVFFTFTMSVPVLALAIWFNVYVFKCLSIIDSYSVIKVRATEPVKEELKWLLGDLYPEEQEVNIDPETLEWEFKTLGATNSEQERFLKAYTPNADLFEKQFFRDKQLNKQKIEVSWGPWRKEKTAELSLDWDKAELYSYQDGKEEYSYSICDLEVPILGPELSPDIDYQILVNGVNPVDHANPEIRIYETNPFRFDDPVGVLPPMLRVVGNSLVIRTNYNGRRWPIYCHYNFPKNNPDFEPEPITWYTLGDLNLSKLKIHFHLFKNLPSNTFKIDKVPYNRLTTYDEFIDQVNKHVAFRILHTSIKGVGRMPRY